MTNPTKVEQLKQQVMANHDGHDHEWDEASIVESIKGQLRYEYLSAHLAEYEQIFERDKANMMTLPSICDNGGFEDGFLHYEGSWGAFNNGSNLCDPYLYTTPTNFIPLPLPNFNRFGIASTGQDDLVGIPKVKFGSRSLRIGNPIEQQEQSIDDVYVSPNPTEQGIVRIVSNLSTTSIAIYGVDGRLLHEHTFDKAEYSYRLEESGVYFLKYIDQTGASRTLKFINP